MCKLCAQDVDDVHILLYDGFKTRIGKGAIATLKDNVRDTVHVNVRMERNLKMRAERLFEEFGMNMTTAINVFLKQTVRDGKIPFEISVRPNAETVAAMEEAERIAHDPNAKRYASFAEILDEVRNEP